MSLMVARLRRTIFRTLSSSFLGPQGNHSPSKLFGRATTSHECLIFQTSQRVVPFKFPTGFVWSCTAGSMLALTDPGKLLHYSIILKSQSFCFTTFLRSQTLILLFREIVHIPRDGTFSCFTTWLESLAAYNEHIVSTYLIDSNLRNRLPVDDTSTTASMNITPPSIVSTSTSPQFYPQYDNNTHASFVGRPSSHPRAASSSSNVVPGSVTGEDGPGQTAPSTPNMSLAVAVTVDGVIRVFTMTECVSVYFSFDSFITLNSYLYSCSQRVVSL